jgi:hypothetical protein
MEERWIALRDLQLSQTETEVIEPLDAVVASIVQNSGCDSAKRERCQL